MHFGLIRKLVRKEKFHPGILGFFINNNYLLRRPLMREIKKSAGHLSGTLLDFGCGSKPYQDDFVNVKEYIGVDLKIEGRDENHAYVDEFYDGKVIPFGNGHFDSLLCTEVLEHVFNIDELLCEFNRVLRTGGRALVTTPFMWEEHEMPHDFARYTTTALEYLYEKHGFRVVEKTKSGNHVEVVFQFALNYIKNTLPNNKYLRQIFLMPFILSINSLGTVCSAVLPQDQTAYFNNVFVLEKI